MNKSKERRESLFFTLLPSFRYRLIEIGLQVWLVVSIFMIVDSPDRYAFLLLFLLLSWRHFTTRSNQWQKWENSRLGLNVHQNVIEWKQGDRQAVFDQAEIKILMTRWFILLKLGHGRSTFSCLLFADSFESIERYSTCRRILIESYHAG